MTREEAKQNLVALGIEEPTDAQVTNYLNQFHARRQDQRTEQRQESENQQNQQSTRKPDEEDEEIKSLREQIESLKNDNIKKDIKAYAAEKGLTGEQAEKILACFQSDLELAKTAIDSMSQIIADKETAAAQAKEKEIADGSVNPGGGAGQQGGKKEEKSADVANAELISFGSEASSQETRDYYKL